MRLIDRDVYLNKMIRVIDSPDIKVITGVRRCGKSKLLELFIEYIKKNIKNNNIIHINFNLKEFENLIDEDELYKYISRKYKKNKNNFVLIDEVQKCNNFENVINSLHAEEKYHIYITGSNAFLLSSDLATLFTGRVFEIDVFPFSFEEYMRYFALNNRYLAIDSYINDGGMAGSYFYLESEDKNKYLRDVYETLILRDIVKKYNIRKKDLLIKLNNYLLDNISNLTSFKKIENILKASNQKADHKTIAKYCEYLSNAYAFYKIGRYDIKGKKYLNTMDKYYLVDVSFRRALLGKKDEDYGRILENIVAIELLRRGYEVFVGTLYNKEIDFVARKNDNKIYIQVADNLIDEKTLEREITPLLQIKDAYKKIIITRLNHVGFIKDGIDIIDISDWLLDYNL